MTSTVEKTYTKLSSVITNSEYDSLGSVYIQDYPLPVIVAEWRRSSQISGLFTDPGALASHIHASVFAIDERFDEWENPVVSEDGSTLTIDVIDDTEERGGVADSFGLQHHFTLGILREVVSTGSSSIPDNHRDTMRGSEFCAALMHHGLLGLGVGIHGRSEDVRNLRDHVFAVHNLYFNSRQANHDDTARPHIEYAQRHANSLESDHIDARRTALEWLAVNNDYLSKDIAELVSDVCAADPTRQTTFDAENAALMPQFATGALTSFTISGTTHTDIDTLPRLASDPLDGTFTYEVLNLPAGWVWNQTLHSLGVNTNFRPFMLVYRATNADGVAVDLTLSFVVS